MKFEGVFAEAAAEGEPLGVLEADRIWNLAFERVDFQRLRYGRGRRRGVDCVFAGVETETFG